MFYLCLLNYNQYPPIVQLSCSLEGSFLLSHNRKFLQQYISFIRESDPREIFGPFRREEDERTDDGEMEWRGEIETIEPTIRGSLFCFYFWLSVSLSPPLLQWRPPFCRPTADILHPRLHVSPHQDLSRHGNIRLLWHLRMFSLDLVFNELKSFVFTKRDVHLFDL